MRDPHVIEVLQEQYTVPPWIVRGLKDGRFTLTEAVQMLELRERAFPGTTKRVTK